MRLCDRVFRYVVERDMDFTFKSYVEFQQKYMRHPNIKKRYYRRLSGNPLYQNAVSTYKMLRCQRFPIRALSKIGTPWMHMMFSTIPLIYFSLSENWEVDKSMLEKSNRILNFFSYCSNIPSDTLLAWEQAKQDMYLLWLSIVD